MTNKFKDLVFYEIYPTSYYDSNNDGIGDLKGITEKLDYVKELGCNAIWLNPFYKSPFKDGGYDISNFFDVDEKFGTLDDLKKLLDKAHKLGIKVIFDLVAGHSSEENPDFIKSASDIDNENKDLYIWTDTVWSFDTGYRLIAGRHPRNGCFMVNFFEFQPAFNFGFNHIDKSWQMSYLDPRTLKAREYIISIMRFYLNMGCDGFRVDMADSLVKNDDEKDATIKVWQYMFDIIKKEFPDSFFVAEWSNPNQALKAGFDGDFVLDHQNNFFNLLVRDSEERVEKRSLFHGGDINAFVNDLKARLEAKDHYNGSLAVISGNHDSRRIATELNVDELKSFYLFLLSIKGIPFIYAGDEIGMKHADIRTKDGGYQRTGDRTPMQWDNSLNMGFSKITGELYLPTGLANKNNVVEQINNKDSLYNFIKNMIKVRKDNPSLTNDQYQITSQDRVITINRGEVSIIMNLSDKELNLNQDKLIISTSGHHILKKNQSAIIKN